MTDAWAINQQRAHNHASFRGMTKAWRRPYRTSGKRPDFTERQLEIALAAHDLNTDRALQIAVTAQNRSTE